MASFFSPRFSSGFRPSLLQILTLGLITALISGLDAPGLSQPGSNQPGLSQPRVGQPQLLAAKPTASEPSAHIRPATQCPERLESLIPLLLRDLPSYANRVSQRAYDIRRSQRPGTVTPGYILLAGRPEYEPLNLEAGEYGSVTENQVPQVFFTTLERQYLSEQTWQLQHYHWLFLAQTESGWRFVLMLSAVGHDSPEGNQIAPQANGQTNEQANQLPIEQTNEQANEPPTPPRDSSQGVIAQAIRLWLRDCEAGSVAGPQVK